MSREFRGAQPDSEIEENHRENRKTDLSIVLARDLVEKVNAREELGLNDYQRSCQYALLCTNQTNLEPPWQIGDLEGYLRFYRDLPDTVGRSNDENAEIFFCGSKHDSPVERDMEKMDRENGITVKAFRTPDGIIYRKILSNTQNGRKERLFHIVKRTLPLHLSPRSQQHRNE